MEIFMEMLVFSLKTTLGIFKTITHANKVRQRFSYRCLRCTFLFVFSGLFFVFFCSAAFVILGAVEGFVCLEIFVDCFGLSLFKKKVQDYISLWLFLKVILFFFTLRTQSMLSDIKSSVYPEWKAVTWHYNTNTTNIHIRRPCSSNSLFNKIPVFQY